MPTFQGLASDVLTLFEPVKVWDTIGEDRTLKGEYKVLAGRMYVVLIHMPCANEIIDHAWFYYSNDLDWDGESKRIIAVGEGRDKSVIQWGSLWNLLTCGIS